MLIPFLEKTVLVGFKESEWEFLVEKLEQNALFIIKKLE